MKWRKKWISSKIEFLNPEKDYAQIVDLMTNWRDNLPFLHHTVYTIGFIRQVADPEIAKTIYRNGAGKIFTSVYERGNEALQFFGNWYKNGPDSEKGMMSIEKMNIIHKNFTISNEQYLYTLSTAVVSADHYRKMVGLKQNSANEKIAFSKFWNIVGVKMHLSAIPETYEDFDKYYDAYEKVYFKPSEEGLLCCEVMIDDFVKRWFTDKPKRGRRFLLSHFDDRLRAVYPLKYPDKITSYLIRKLAFLSGWYARYIKEDAQKPQYVEDSFTHFQRLR